MRVEQNLYGGMMLLVFLFVKISSASVYTDFSRNSNLLTWSYLITGEHFQNQTTALTSNKTDYNYNYYDVSVTTGLSFATSLSSSLNVGFAISGFIAYNNSEWSPQIKLKQVTSTNMVFTYRVLGNTHMIFIGVNSIIIKNIDPYTKIYSACKICQQIGFNTSILNSGTGYRIQYRNQTTTLARKNLKVSIFIFGFQFFHHDSQNSFLKATAIIKNYSNIIQYSFSTAEKCTVNSLCYTTVVFDYIGAQLNNYYYVGDMSQYSLSNTVDPTSIIVSPVYLFYHRIFMGINSFNLSNSNLQLSFRFESNFNNFAQNYATNNGTYDVTLSAYFSAYRNCGTKYYNPNLMQCETTCSTLYNFSSTRLCTSSCHYTCDTCSGPGISQCTTCDTTRQVPLATPSNCPCLSGYIDIGQQICMQCKVYLPGCTTCTSKTVCTGCQAGFYLSGGNCRCSSGKQISGICTSIVGCVNILIVGLSEKCIQCNSTLGYTLFNFQCICTNGYSSDGVHCKSVCGDGVLQYDQQCDDNNLINGDGCSSQCKIQDQWKCASSPSICKLNVDPKLSLRYVSRIVTSNTMFVSFSLNPYHSKLSQINLNQFISHNVPANNFRAIYVHPGLLNLEFDYYKSIQGNKYQITFNLPNDLFYSTSSTAQIPASGMNAKLTYDKYYDHTFPLEIVVYIVDALAILIFAVGVFIEKFIVVEMIQTIQLPLFMLVLLSNCPSTFEPIQKLRYSNGYNYIQEQDKVRAYSYSYRISSIGIQKDFLLNFNVMYAAIILTILASIITKMINWCLSKQKKKINKQKKGKLQTILDKIFTIFFEKLFIGIGLLSMYQVLFSLIVMVNSNIVANQNVVSIYIDTPASVLAGFIIIVVILLVMMNYFTGKLNLLSFYFTSPCYPTFYVTINLLLIMFISVLFNQDWTIFFVSGVLLFNLVTLIIVRPYSAFIHNFSIVFNQVVLIYTAALYLIGQYTSNNETTNWEIVYIIGLYILIFMFFLVIFGTIFRLWHWMYYQDYIIPIQQPIKSNKKQIEQTKQVEFAKQVEFTQQPIVKIEPLIYQEFIGRQDRVHLQNIKKIGEQSQSLDQKNSVDSILQLKRRLRQNLMKKAQTMNE